jgi:hypothetical protein
VKKPIRRGRSIAIINRNIEHLMRLGYTYPQAVRAAHTLAITPARANPIDPNTKILLIGGAMVAGAVGIALIFLANKATTGTAS